jgi:lipopolysaccharide transport system ATP-binding protein
MYHLGKRLDTQKTLREAVTDTIASPFRRFRRLWRGDRTPTDEASDLLWALKGVSCEIRRGEVVGIIGHNGAGKSTLLKVLSRITEPTSGFAEIRGRVGSLLEVDAGFHLELTGRENIFLNGAILGMRKTEIIQKLDEIIAFAEVERFLDTPVKHYSSGMYMRLAFAVAAHLEPEILLVDEVLAVGDLQFQKKCLNKMEAVGQQGRTVLFVSHNISAITRLCSRIILLSDGRVVEDGPAHQVVKTYLNTGLGTTARREWPDLTQAPGDGVTRLRAVRVRNERGEISETLDIRQPICLEMEYEVLEPGHLLMCDLSVHSDQGICIFTTFENSKWANRPHPAGGYVSHVRIPGNFLAEGTLYVSVGVVTREPLRVHFDIVQVVAFQVVDTLDGDSARAGHAGHIAGVVRPLLTWTTKPVPRDFEGAGAPLDQRPVAEVN